MGETLELDRFRLRCSPLFSSVLCMTTAEQFNAAEAELAAAIASGNFMRIAIASEAYRAARDSR